MELDKILESFVKGVITQEKAKELIESMYENVKPNKDDPKKVLEKASEKDSNAEEKKTHTDTIFRTIERLRKNKNIDELIKVSSEFMHQISGNVPVQIQALQENVLPELNIAGFATNIKGITSKFSMFRAFEVSDCSKVSENQAIGSQWFGVRFKNVTEIHRNKFTAIQMSEFNTNASDFLDNAVSLTRISQVTLTDSKMRANKISRSTLSDTVIENSSLIENRMSKSEFKQSLVKNSELKNISMNGVTFSENELDECFFQNLEFENCRFEECVFERVRLAPKKIRRIADRTIIGRNFSDCTSYEDFLTRLEANTSDTENEKVVVPKKLTGAYSGKKEMSTRDDKCKSKVRGSKEKVQAESKKHFEES